MILSSVACLFFVLRNNSHNGYDRFDRLSLQWVSGIFAVQTPHLSMIYDLVTEQNLVFVGGVQKCDAVFP